MSGNTDTASRTRTSRITLTWSVTLGYGNKTYEKFKDVDSCVLSKRRIVSNHRVSYRAESFSASDATVIGDEDYYSYGVNTHTEKISDSDFLVNFRSEKVGRYE